MLPLYRRLVIAVALLLCCSLLPTYAQKLEAFSEENVRGFADYLETIGEYRRAAQELERLMPFESTSADSLPLRIGTLYQKAGAFKTAQQTFQRALRSSEIPAGSAIRYALATAYYQQLELDSALLILSGIPRTVRTSLLASLCHAEQGSYNSAQHELDAAGTIDTTATGRFSPLHAMLREHENLPSKSPLLAGVMSAILPGSGKAYVGQYNDAILSFVTIGSLAYAAYDGFSTHGSSSTRGWIYASLAGGLYLGNIYGSVLSASIVRDNASHVLTTRIRAAFSLFDVP
jgi:tetratricopeptide (TPR) repeat protein